MKKELVNEYVLDQAQRRRRAMVMRRNAKKIARIRKIKMGRFASTDQLLKRAALLARKLVRKRVAGQRGISYAKLSVGDKIQIDRLVERQKQFLKRMIPRLLPKVRRAEQVRLSKYMANRNGKKNVIKSFAQRTRSPYSLINAGDYYDQEQVDNLLTSKHDETMKIFAPLNDQDDYYVDRNKEENENIDDVLDADYEKNMEYLHKHYDIKELEKILYAWFDADSGGSDIEANPRYEVDRKSEAGARIHRPHHDRTEPTIAHHASSQLFHKILSEENSDKPMGYHIETRDAVHKDYAFKIQHDIAHVAGYHRSNPTEEFGEAVHGIFGGWRVKHFASGKVVKVPSSDPDTEFYEIKKNLVAMHENHMKKERT